MAHEEGHKQTDLEKAEAQMEKWAAEAAAQKKKEKAAKAAVERAKEKEGALQAGSNAIRGRSRTDDLLKRVDPS